MEPILPVANVYGNAVKTRRVAGLRMAETRYAPGLRVPKHSHEHAYFSLVLAGNFDGVYGKSAQVGGPLRAVFRPAGEPHSVHFRRAGARLFSVEVEGRQLERAREHSSMPGRSTELAGGELAWLALRMYREACALDEVSPLAVEGLFLEMLAEASRHSTMAADRRPRWLEQAREFIDESFSDGLTVAGIAATVGVHPVHLATVFRKHYRRTIGEYVRRLRVEYACRRLSLSDATLAEIALAAGFSDQSHFSKTFKRLTGLTPARFRAAFRRP